MRSANPVVGKLMDLLNPWEVRVMGATINRRNAEKVQEDGLILAKVEDLGMGGIVKYVCASSVAPRASVVK